MLMPEDNQQANLCLSFLWITYRQKMIGPNSLKHALKHALKDPLKHPPKHPLKQPSEA